MADIARSAVGGSHALERDHVAVFLPFLTGGGAERSTLLIAEGMARSGLRVDLITMRAVGSRLPQVPSTVRLVDLDAPRICCVFFFRPR